MTPLIARVAALTALTIASAGLATACASSTGNEVDDTESSSALTGGEKSAYEYFVAKGLKNYQAAGIIGNLIQESNVNPDSYSKVGPDGGSPSGRREAAGTTTDTTTRSGTRSARRIGVLAGDAARLVWSSSPPSTITVCRS